MKKPLISQGWLRAILFVVIYLVGTMAAGLFMVGCLFIWNFIVGSNANNVAALKALLGQTHWLIAVVNVLGAFISVWFARKVIDKQSFISLGFYWKGNETHAYAGFFGAIAMLSIGTIILLLLKYLTFTDVNFDVLSLLKGAGLMILVAFSEEIVFRGYLLNNLMQSMNKWLALSITAVVFASMHLGNPGMAFFSFLEIAVAGIMLGVNYIYTKNLWFGIFLHFAWNFMQGSILGYEVSGTNQSSFLHQSLNGPTLVTGGNFGFEGSILCLALNLIFIAVLVMKYEKGTIAVENNLAAS